MNLSQLVEQANEPCADHMTSVESLKGRFLRYVRMQQSFLRVEFVEANHFSHLENPTAVNQAIRRFLDSA